MALTDRLANRIRTTLGAPTPTRLPVIPIGVEVDRFRPDWSGRTGRRALGVGVIARFKRWELAARAVRGTDVELTLAGPIADAAYAAELRTAGPNVRLLGEVDDATLQTLYAESDYLLHPSAVELLAGVVLQGLASGLPVLGAEAVSGLVEPGRTGFIAGESAGPDGIVRALADRLRELRADAGLRRSFGEAARASAEHRFSWPVVARAHLALYRSVAGRG